MAVDGLRIHFDLLKKEHQSLSTKYTELLQSGGHGHNTNGLASQLVSLVHDIYKKEFLCDVDLLVGEKKYPSHKFLLRARSDYWEDLASIQSIEFPKVSTSTFDVVYHWLYTDSLSSEISDPLLLQVAEQACKYRFIGLQETCELWLVSRLDVTNCVPVFEFAENNKLIKLSEHCSALVASRWSAFTKDHFSCLSATLLYRLLKGNSDNVLRSIIQLEREDVLFLFFIDNDAKLPVLLNNKSAEMVPLEEALSLNLTGMTSQLVQHGADVNLVYSSADRSSILMRLIRSGNANGLRFLCHNKVNLNGIQDSVHQLSPLQQVCSLPLSEQMMAWLDEALPQFQVNFFSVNEQGPARTPLSTACLNPVPQSVDLVRALLRHSAGPNVPDSDGLVPLYHALFSAENHEVAQLLIEAGADVNVTIENEPLLHLLVEKPESVAFLLKHKPDLKTSDSKGHPILHHAILSTSDKERLGGLLKSLAEAGAEVGTTDSSRRTALHLAITSGPYVVEALLPFLKSFPWETKDRDDKTVLQLALAKKDLQSAQLLLDAGAPVDPPGGSLLLETLHQSDDEVAVFILKNNADYHKKDSAGRTALELAVANGLTATLRSLCSTGANMNQKTSEGPSVLEKALTSGHMECASILVGYGADLQGWSPCEDGEQTLLHHMMDLGNEGAAIFLIENGADCNIPKRYTDPSNDDGQTPLHMAVGWGLTRVAEALIKYGADLNAQDKDDRTACHIAIREGNAEALELLLTAPDIQFLSTRDKLGQTPLSLAIGRKDHKNAAAIVTRQPHASLQTNGNGENLLHVSVRTNDLESVLFILGTHTDPTRTTQDQRRRTALHMAANIDNELIMRNLILAGCVVDARSSDGSTPLHEAVRARRANLVSILLENNANTAILDERGEVAWLCAVRAGSLECLKVLIEHNCLSGPLINKMDQSALHLCANLTPDRMEKGTTAVDLCEAVLKHEERNMTEKEFAMFIDARDKHGNTALLSAFMQGNSGVCRCLLKRAATMGAKNADGLTIFTYETPTKQLLFGLLDSLEREPRWSDGELCDCGHKFSITQRKHHCRHCGRAVCSPCSTVFMPILKFGEEKKVRVCNMCSIVLTEGISRF